MIFRWYRDHPLRGALIVLALWNVIWLAQIGFFKGAVTLAEPDTIMRLAIAHDMQGNGWQRPVTFLREDAPFGMALHWSSLFFWAILAIARLLWFMPQTQALLISGIFAGPTLQAVSIVAAFWAVKPLLKPQLAAAFALTVIFEPVAMAYSHAGTANHHAIMILVALVLFGTGIRSDFRPLGWRLCAGAGMVAALGLWVSFETLLLVELLWGYLFLLWIEQGRPVSGDLLMFSTVSCGVSLLCLLIDPPYGGYANPELDRISLPYIFLIGLQLACVLAIRAVSPSTVPMRLIWLGILSVLVFLAEAMVFPMVLAGPEGQINPFVKSEWQPYIAEMQRVSGLTENIVYLGNGLIGVTVLMGMRIAQHWKKVLYLCGLVCLGILAQRYLRFLPYFCIAGSLPCYLALQKLGAGTNLARRQIWLVLTPYCAFFLIFGCQTLGESLYKRPANFQEKKLAQCDLDAVLPALRDRPFLRSEDPAPIFVTELDKSSLLLFRTDYRVLAGNYHIDVRGLNDSYLMMRDMGWNTARSIVMDHGISYLLLCPTSDRDRYGVTSSYRYWKESTPEKELREPTFYTRIMDGTLPPWLIQRQWPEGVKTDLKLFQVVTPPAPP